MVRERASKNGVALALEIEPEVQLVDGRRAPDQADALQPALERGQVHAGRRPHRRRARAASTARSRSSVGRHRRRHRARGPATGSSRSSSRPTPARSSRGHRARPRALEAARRAARRPIWVESEAGRGSRFVFTLPVERGGGLMAGERDPDRRGQREEHEARPRHPPGHGLQHARGGDRRGRRSRSPPRAPRPRADGHPAAGHRRRRGARGGSARTSGPRQSRCSR